MNSVEKKNSCQICGKIFSTSQYIDIHMRIHTKEKPYSCEICAKSFSALSNKISHMRTHTVEKPYSCNICGKSFSDKGNKDKHMKTHAQEKPYSCEICGKSFSRLNSKDVHMRTHTGEKPYSCQICEKSFITSGDKNKHMRVHTGEKLYSCQICGKLFSQSCNKDIHMRTHTGEKPYSCNICKKSFSRSSHIDRHMRTHIREKPYSCGKTFTTSYYRDKHEKGHNDKDIHLQSTMKPVCVMIKKLSPTEINEMCEKCIKDNTNVSDIDISDNTIANPELKEDDTTNISQVKTENAEIQVEEEDLVKKYWEEFTSDLPEIMEKETIANDSLSIKEEPAFIDNADVDVNVKEEETCDYLYDSDTIDKIDIEEFKLEEPDV